MILSRRYVLSREIKEQKRDEIEHTLENIDSADNVYIEAAVTGNNADITEIAIVEN